MQMIEAPLVSLWKASWEGAVLIVMVLLVQWAFRRRLHPRWRYGLWLLVLARLALLWAIPAPVSLFNWLKLSPPSLTSRATPKTLAAKPVPSGTAIQPAAANNSAALA